MSEEIKEEATACEGSCTCECRMEKADGIVRSHMLVALGAGVLPPVADLAALSAVQVRMLCLLSEAYGIQFKEEINKSLVASIISGYGVPTLFAGAVSSLIKLIPFVSTYALGKVFIHHFESGGNLLNFSPAKMREYYYAQYKKGEELVKQQGQESK